MTWAPEIIDTFEIKGRGTVYAVAAPEERKRDGAFMGEKVIINGEERTIYAVESYALGVIRKGSTIGIMVR